MPRRPRHGEQEGEVPPDVLATTGRSTCWRRRGSSCSARAMSGSWWACRCSCASVLGWRFWEVGGFMALWVIGYGVVQASPPALLRRVAGGASARTGARRRCWRSRWPRFPAAIAAGAERRAGPGAGGGGRAAGLRRGVRPELLGALVPDPGLHRRRQGGDERGLLLHGQRARPAGRHGALGRAVPGGRAGGVPVGVGGVRAGRRRRLARCCRARAARRPPALATAASRAVELRDCEERGMAPVPAVPATITAMRRRQAPVHA